MKRIFICVFTIFTITLSAEKKASLIIHSNNSNDLKFISHLKVVGLDTAYYKNMSFTKEDFILTDIQIGKYKIKFHSIFYDSIVTQIDISKGKKYKINFPDFGYKKSEDFKDFNEKLNSADKININVFTEVSDISWYSERIYLYRNISYYYKQVFGIEQNNNTLEQVLSDKTNFDKMKEELNLFINLSRNNESNCGGIFNEVISHAIILINNEYLDFSFCPEKHTELYNITKNIRGKE